MNLLKKLGSFFVMCLMLISCGEEKKGANLAEQFSALKPYKLVTTSINMRVNIPDNGDVTVIVKDEDWKEVNKLVATGGQLETQLTGLNANEVYFLDVSGTHSSTGNWAQTVPLLVTENGNFEVVAVVDQPYHQDPHSVKILGGGEEQEFLERWNDKYANAIVNLSDEGEFVNPHRNVNQEFINEKKPFIGTFFLIHEQKNVKEHLEEYAQLYLSAPPAVQQSKYGLDVYNQIYRITNAPKQIDFTKILTARTSRLLPFEIKDYTNSEFLVLYIWATWDPVSSSQLDAVQDIVQKYSHADLLYFSLDTRMSDWKPVSDDRKFEHSFMVRAETRQASIDLLYLTELPRILIVQPDGTVVENEVDITRLDEVLANLKK